MSMQQYQRLLAALGLVFLIGVLLACGAGVPLGTAPRWACPSPLPLPWGPSGPIKSTDTISRDGELVTENSYYEEWEQEYGSLGGPPFPSPTPYGIKGTSFVLGQRVEVGALHVTVAARNGPDITLPGITPGSQRLYFVDIAWHNASLDAIPINYRHDVRIRAVTAPSGAILTDSTWGMSDNAGQVANIHTLPNTIPPGDSTVSVPVIAPMGTVKIAEIVFVGSPGYRPALPSATSDPGTPSPTEAVPLTPTATATLTPTSTTNDDLRNNEPVYLTVQWTDATIAVGPPCDDAGAVTAWGDGKGVSWGPDMPIAIAAPPGAARVVQIALNQVGKHYVWGAKGPEVFDCSGLATWAYGQIGMRIPQGTSGQWPGMRPVSQAELQPGDLIFFNVAGTGIDHVGMLAGDLNGDGTWDMVHASAPCCGVRVEYDVLNQRFWKPKIAGFRTAR